MASETLDERPEHDDTPAIGGKGVERIRRAAHDVNDRRQIRARCFLQPDDALGQLDAFDRATLHARSGVVGRRDLSTSREPIRFPRQVWPWRN